MGNTIAIQGDVHVVDSCDDRIQKFTADNQFPMKFCTIGSGERQFDRPTDVVVEGEVTIFVTAWNHPRPGVFNADGSFITQSTGEASLSKWGTNELDVGNLEMWHERAIAQCLDRDQTF